MLFTLIGVTFVLVASQSRRATRADSRHEQYGDDPQRVLDAVFGQIVRDTTNPRSSLQGHSLLADMYGNDGVKMVSAPGTPITVALPRCSTGQGSGPCCLSRSRADTTRPCR